MRAEPTILHVDLDAFFAAVEQRDKPSLRGKPVVVGGVVGGGGGHGVVRGAGLRGPLGDVDARGPAAVPARGVPRGRFDAYRAASDAVMAVLRELSPLVEPLSLDEAFVDLAAAGRALTFERRSRAWRPTAEGRGRTR